MSTQSNPKLGLLVCSKLRLEFKTALANLGRNDILLESYEKACGVDNPRSREHQSKALEKLRAKVEELKVLSPFPCFGKCAGDETCLAWKDYTCLEFYIPQPLLDQLMRDGAYITTPGWLVSWKKTVLEQWGFPENEAKDFFREFAKKIVLLDTKVHPDIISHLEEFAGFLALPFEVLDVGTSYLELRLDKFLNDWIKGREAKSTQLKIKNQQLQIANLSMLYDLIPQLAESESESLIIEKTRDLLQMFFAPKEVVCYRTQDGVGQLVGGKSDDFDFESFLNRIKEQRNHEVDVVGDGFIYHVSYQEHSLVYFAVQELAFPGNIRDYLEVLSLLSNYLSLFIARAREHDRGLDLQNEILERDKSIIKKNEELAEAVNTKDKFFSILAHDLRSPFNAMLGFSELLQEDYANLTDNERLEYIGIVSESLKGSFALLNDLLEWSRAQRGALTFKPKVSLLQNIFNASKEELDKVAIQKGVNLTFNTADDLEIYGDFNMMRTILRNIISNAIKFCSSGQNIHVKGYSKEGNQVISIKDEGVGMSSQQLDSLFNVAQTKSTIGTSGEKGSGLGLILCKEFMDVHKGEIQVSSQEGQGSEFLLFFPGSISS